jgi:hypothetical protein
MDDYSVASLGESKNEWCARLVNTLSPAIIIGLKSIFTEAWKLCEENTQTDKYLMTFQTFLTRVPQWNSTIIENECKRITDTTGCGYLEELISCVHIIHLKALTCIRVGQKQKKVDINIPSVNEFIHKIYINAARKIYTTIYLFEKNIAPLEVQKRNRELELIVREGILNTIREGIPVEDILRAYMSETVEQDVEVQEMIEQIPLPKKSKPTTTPTEPPAPADETTPKVVEQVKMNIAEINSSSELPNLNNANASITKLNDDTSASNTNVIESNINKISFSEVDMVKDTQGIESTMMAPKSIDHLEEMARHRMMTEAANRNNNNDDDDDNDKIRIGGDIQLDIIDVNELDRPMKMNNNNLLLDDIELLS